MYKNTTFPASARQKNSKTNEPLLDTSNLSDDSLGNPFDSDMFGAETVDSLSYTVNPSISILIFISFRTGMMISTVM
jgi:hypothetical protein